MTVQGTIKQPISFEGKGLHTGKFAKITIYPAVENTGIVFQRIDKAGKNTKIYANWKNIKQLPLCTCVASENNIHVRTIEHLMAAFYACGIDNALIKIKGSEIPILDGSAKQFIARINEAGVQQQFAKRSIYRFTEKIEIKEDNHRQIIVEPSDDGLIIDITVLISEVGAQKWTGKVTPEFFSEQISSSRTFGHLRDGLFAQLSRFTSTPVCLGANTKTAVVLGKQGKILNKEGLRSPDELVKHRLLDLVGDLMLSGGHIQAKITTVGSVHRLTHQLLREAFIKKILI